MDEPVENSWPVERVARVPAVLAALGDLGFR
jgi:hypothetical protein